MPTIQSTRKIQAGVTLIEVLIAIVVLAVGLLGIAGLQASALTNTAVSYQYTQVATVTQGLVERMRSNRNAVIDSSQPYALPASTSVSPPVNCSSATCTPAQTAKYDLSIWLQSIAANLPNGQGSVACLDASCVSTSNWIITVYWNSDRSASRTGTGCTTASSDLNCFRLIYRP